MLYLKNLSHGRMRLGDVRASLLGLMAPSFGMRQP